MGSPAIVRPAREAWLEERRSLITASDVAAILGYDPFRGALAVYAAKVAGVESEETAQMRRGRRMESVILAEYVDATGRTARLAEPYTLVRHPDLRWLAATPDGWTEDASREPGQRHGVVELKMVGRAHAHDWDDGKAPLGHALQVQVQLACTSHAWGSLAGLVGLEAEAPEVRDYERHDRVLELIVPRLDAFRLAVLRREPPPADGLDSTARAIKALWPTADGASVDLDAEAQALADELGKVRAQKSGAEKREQEIANVLKARIGAASFGLLPDGSRLACPTRKRAGYTVEPTTYRELRRKWPRLKGRV